jgi:hypothetical protein
MLASWHAEGDSYRFETDLVAGRYLTAGHYQGMRSLVHRPSGVQVAAGETLPGLVAPYRVFGNGRRFGDVRDRPTRVEIVPEGLRVTHPADGDNPFEVVSVYTWRGATLDVAYTITTSEALRGFEIGVASYLAAGFRAYVSRQSNVWGESSSRIVPVDANPMTDVYALFPRGEAELKTIFDGRWDLPLYPVRYAVPAYFAHALAFRRHARSGVTALGMADSKECYAVCIPVNDPPDDPDPARGYQGVYFYLFGRDVGQHETLTTRVRWVIGQNLPDEALMAHWAAFAGGPAATRG